MVNWVGTQGPAIWDATTKIAEKVGDKVSEYSKKAWNWAKEQFGGSGSSGSPDPDKFDKAKKIFENGKDFESSIKYNGTQIDALAEVEINQTELILKNITIYSKGAEATNQIGARAFLQWQNSVINIAKEQGFTTLRIMGERVAGSSSANPGKVVEYIIDLTTR